MNRRQAFALIAPALIVLASAFAVTLAFGSAVAPVAATTSPMANITVMLDEFMPVFMQIFIVMIFFMMILMFVGKIGGSGNKKE